MLSGKDPLFNIVFSIKKLWNTQLVIQHTKLSYTFFHPSFKCINSLRMVLKGGRSSSRHISSQDFWGSHVQGLAWGLSSPMPPVSRNLHSAFLIFGRQSSMKSWEWIHFESVNWQYVKIRVLIYKNVRNQKQRLWNSTAIDTTQYSFIQNQSILINAFKIAPF